MALVQASVAKQRPVSSLQKRFDLYQPLFLIWAIFKYFFLRHLNIKVHLK